jgi:hypothetical protein
VALSRVEIQSTDLATLALPLIEVEELWLLEGGAI